MKFNEDTVRKLEESFAIGASVSEACYYADISRETYYRWEKENPELKEKYDRLKEKPVLKARQTIAKALDNVDVAKWYLERKLKGEFSLRSELTGKDGADLLPKPILDLQNVQPNISNQEDTKPLQED